jgi:methyl-galactoside transport system substrate-binding protein
MQRFVRLAAIGSMALAMLAACAGTPSTGSTGESAPASASGSAAAGASQAAGGGATIGVAMYKKDDTFMASVSSAIEAAAQSKSVTVNITDGQNAQATQNEQVDLFLARSYPAMAINPVDRTAATTIISKAKAADVPVVFFNREPLAEDMASWDKVYYVGAKAEESGTFQGQILADYWKATPTADKNGDGKLQYVMLTGQPGHQDAELRTEFSVKAITDAGIEVEELANDTANWNRVEGQEKMAAFLGSQGDKIEAVLANNDDMALGAIEALKAQGYFSGDKFMPVVGVDATAPALGELKAGTLLGTVLNDAENQGAATLNLAAALAQDQAPSKDTVGFDIVDGKYVWVPYQKVTPENVAQFE